MQSSLEWGLCGRHPTSYEEYRQSLEEGESTWSQEEGQLPGGEGGGRGRERERERDSERENAMTCLQV